MHSESFALNMVGSGVGIENGVAVGKGPEGDVGIGVKVGSDSLSMLVLGGLAVGVILTTSTNSIVERISSTASDVSMSSR